MNRILSLSLIVAVLLWFVFATVLLGYAPGWLPERFARLERPSSLADFGQAFTLFDGLISSLALMLAIVAVLIQVKQNTDANVIGALTARLQFLLADYERLDRQIGEYIAKHSGQDSYQPALVENMVKKCRARLEESQTIDEKLRRLLEKF